jgi:AmmeMemoRadiSam system protein B
MFIRRPAVAGAFYAASPDSLKKQITNCFLHKLGPMRLPDIKKSSNIISVVCPHAGYMYSGPSSAHSYLALSEQEEPDSIVVIGPNHTGWGTPVSVMREGIWKTPLGEVIIDKELADKIIKHSPIAKGDESAFIREHSIEVQLPFLQFIYSKFKFVPICMGWQDLETSIELGRAIYEASTDKEIIVVASSDLTHKEPKSSAYKKDQYILDAILEMDEKKLQDSVKKHKISTCGYGPISATLIYSKLKNATTTKILSYYTSGDIIGNNNAVVGYASAKLLRI